MTSDESAEAALERALRAPGSPSELADEESYRAMFRDAQGAPVAVVPFAPGRTAVRRLGTSTALAVVVAAATGGVAAAYSSNLPDPMQRAVHSVLAPLGVPQVQRQRPVARKPTAPSSPSSAASPSASASATRDVRPSTRPSSPVVGPSAASSPTSTSTPSPTASSTASTSPSSSPSASSSASASPSASPSETPTTSAPSPSVPPSPKPATVTIASAGANNLVAPGGTALVTGQVTDPDGSPVPDRQVVLQARRPGGGWSRLAVARTGADGSVSVATPPVERTTAVRLRAGTVHSSARRIVVQPSLTASARTVGTMSTVTARAIGGQPGDVVLLLTRRAGKLVQEGQGMLDGDGAVSIDVAAPTQDRTYVVVLPGTRDHAGTRVRVVVPGP